MWVFYCFFRSRKSKKPGDPITIVEHDVFDTFSGSFFNGAAPPHPHNRSANEYYVTKCRHFCTVHAYDPTERIRYRTTMSVVTFPGILHRVIFTNLTLWGNDKTTPNIGGMIWKGYFFHSPKRLWSTIEGYCTHLYPTNPITETIAYPLLPINKGLIL